MSKLGLLLLIVVIKMLQSLKQQNVYYGTLEVLSTVNAVSHLTNRLTDWITVNRISDAVSVDITCFACIPLNRGVNCELTLKEATCVRITCHWLSATYSST